MTKDLTDEEVKDLAMDFLNSNVGWPNLSFFDLFKEIYRWLEKEGYIKHE